MRLLSVVLLGLAACARATPSAPASKEPAAVLPAIEASPATIPAAELGAEGVAAEWIELAMPADAKIFGYAHDVEGGRETWTLAEAGPKRLLRVRFEDGKKLGQAAWVGTATKDGGMTFRLVEVRGNVRFASENMVAKCGRDPICEVGKPSHQVNASLCVFDGDGMVSDEAAWFAPGKGVDFSTGPCRTENTTRESLMKRPRGFMQHGF